MRSYRATLTLSVLFWGISPLSAQDSRKPDPAQAHPAVDQKAVDAAIQRGVVFLENRVDSLNFDPANPERFHRRHELILWTLVHAGVAPDDPAFDKLLQYILTQPLERTYLVSLQAMVLEEIDRVTYQWRIAQCAQFLVDNQCENGQWAYGEPFPMPENLETPPTAASSRGAVASKSGRTPGPSHKTVAKSRDGKPTPRRRIQVQKRQKASEDKGDNSNSQYAALGLRACADSGIVIDPSVLRRAKTFYEQTQLPDGGWSYDDWFKNAYGSISAGSLGSLCIYHHLLNEPWQKDPKVLKGIDWMAKNFSVSINPGTLPKWAANSGEGDQWWRYYYLYALERLGVLYGTEFFGTHEWYPEGATRILAEQGPGGEWKYDVDTCFAILFLRRATRPLRDVATKSGATKR